MAVVEISWERYNDAKPHLAKALSLLPGDPRALYYRALVERNAGQVKEAIDDFKAMLAKYPRAKDGLRELGFSYYQQHDYPEARDNTRSCRPSIPTTSPPTTSSRFSTAASAKKKRPPSSQPNSPTRRTTPPLRPTPSSSCASILKSPAKAWSGTPTI